VRLQSSGSHGDGSADLSNVWIFTVIIPKT